jgi:SNF2 family DNA or RNA helicase
MRVCHELGGDVLPGVVFCPSAMRHTWKREIEKWWPGVRAAVVAGSAAKRRRLLEDAEHDFYCLNWESARLHSRLAPYGSTAMTDKEKEPKELQALRPRTVVADEAHALRNASKQTRAVWATGHQDSVTYRFALTGTPIADTPADAWGLLHFLDPDEHPGRTRYVDRYVETTYDWAGYLVMGGLNPATKDEFFRATDPRTRRVTKAEAMPHLPPIIPETRVVEMSDKQAKAYKQIRDSQLTALDGGVLTVTNGLDALTRLSQFASSYAEVSYAEECRHKVPVGQPCTSCAGDVALPAEIVTLVEPSNKVDAMEELLEELGPTEPLVVCAASRQLIELAERRLDHLDVSHVSVKGGQTADFRQAQVDAFQEGKSRVMLFTLQAGGTGLTLTRARVMAILQGSWDAIQMSQAKARVHREGSQVHENVLIIEYVSDKTVELGRLEALAGKGDRLEEVVRDQEALRNFFLQGDEAPKQKRAPRKRAAKKPEPPPVVKRCPVAAFDCPFELEGTDPCGSISCWGEGPVEVDPDTDETKEAGA